MLKDSTWSNPFTHSHTHWYSDGRGCCTRCKPALQEQFEVHLYQGYLMCSYVEVSVVEAWLQERERWRGLGSAAPGDWFSALSITHLALLSWALSTSLSSSRASTTLTSTSCNPGIEPPTFQLLDDFTFWVIAVEEKVFLALSTQHIDH